MQGSATLLQPVYELCAEGKLPHARILSAIRIVPADLGEFVMTRRRGA